MSEGWHPAFSLHACSTNLSSGIDDFGEKRLAFVDNLMAEGILDRRIVALDKMAFAVLDRQRGFACARNAKVSRDLIPPLPRKATILR